MRFGQTFGSFGLPCSYTKYAYGTIGCHFQNALCGINLIVYPTYINVNSSTVGNGGYIDSYSVIVIGV